MKKKTKESILEKSGVHKWPSPNSGTKSLQLFLCTVHCECKRLLAIIILNIILPKDCLTGHWVGQDTDCATFIKLCSDAMATCPGGNKHPGEKLRKLNFVQT